MTQLHRLQHTLSLRKERKARKTRRKIGAMIDAMVL